MTTLNKTAGAAGSISFTTKNSAGQLITPASAPTVSWYTDTGRTAGAVALTVTGSGSAYTASWLAASAPVTPVTRYLKFTIEVSTGVFDVDADDDISFVDATVDVSTGLVTLAQVKTYMGLTTTVHDDELNRLIGSATGAVQTLAGTTLIAGSYVERVPASSQLLLQHYPVTAVTSVALVANGVTTVYDGDPTGYAILDADIGQIASPYSSGLLEVTVTAGLSVIPDEAADAALVFIAYKYRRNHGGSETYMPAGADTVVVAPMGVTALREQMRLALGQYAGGPHVA